MNDYHDPTLPGDEIDLLDLVKVVWRARWTIVAVTIIAVIAASAFTLTKERVYESRAVFAIQKQTVPTGMGGSNEAQQSFGVLAGMLNSRQLAETVVDSLALTDVWEHSRRDRAVKQLRNNLSIQVNASDSIITISFEDTDPVLARDIVASYVNLFEAQTHDLTAADAEHSVKVTGERLAEAEVELAEAEDALRRFQESYGIVSFSQQTQSLVNAHATLTDRIRTLTVELTGKRSYLTDRDPEVQQLLSRIAELERQALAVQFGTDAGSRATGAGLIAGADSAANNGANSAGLIAGADPGVRSDQAFGGDPGLGSDPGFRSDPGLGSDPRANTGLNTRETALNGGRVDGYGLRSDTTDNTSTATTGADTATDIPGLNNLNFGLQQVPGISMELQRLEREVTIKRDMYELLRQQYEVARLDASRHVSITRLIDPPEVPTEPRSRGLALNVALAAFVGAFAALMLAFIGEFLRQRAQDDDVVRDLPFLRYFRKSETSA